MGNAVPESVSALSEEAVPSESEVARLRAMLDTMPVIEQAKGILMAQYRCGPDEAFEILRRASGRANVKVRVIAAQLIAQVALF
jgi:AmiR/NasT family two-component response regulator